MATPVFPFVEETEIYPAMDGEANVPASGTKLTAEQFAKGQWVDVIGVTKGRGFAGVVKRYRFSGQRQTHGSMETLARRTA